MQRKCSLYSGHSWPLVSCPGHAGTASMYWWHHCTRTQLNGNHAPRSGPIEDSCARNSGILRGSPEFPKTSGRGPIGQIGPQVGSLLSFDRERDRRYGWLKIATTFPTLPNLCTGPNTNHLAMLPFYASTLLRHRAAAVLRQAVDGSLPSFPLLQQ